jgi:hypothetical protein
VITGQEEEGIEAEGGDEAMTPATFPELPGWNFQTAEVSAGVYRVRGMDRAGRSVEKTGTDAEALLESCRQLAREITSSDSSRG